MTLSVYSIKQIALHIIDLLYFVARNKLQKLYKDQRKFKVLNAIHITVSFLFFFSPSSLSNSCLFPI